MKHIINDTIEDISAIGALPAYAVISAVTLAFNITAGVQLFVGLVISYIITIFIRSIYFKTRPKAKPKRNYIEKVDASSFPSLHSMRISILAIVISFHAILFLPVAIFTATAVFYSRLHLKKHFIIDVAAGAIIGIIISWVLIRYVSVTWGVL